MPIGKSSATFNFLLQPLSIRTQPGVREILAANLKGIYGELIRDVAAVLGGFRGRRLHFEGPAFGAGEGAAELVVVRVVDRVVAVAAVDDDSEFADAVVDG